MSDGRPSWLDPYALVTGTVPSAPLDLPQRMDAVYRFLKNEGWRVVVKSVGTDFSGPFGLPIPRDQMLELYLYREIKFTPTEAQEALTRALLSGGVSFSPIGAWLGEIVKEVVVPTFRDAAQVPKKATETLVWWALGGLAVFVLVARATAPAADSYARLTENLRRR